MKRIDFAASLGVAITLLVWAFSTHGKEGMLIFFFGAALLLCTLVLGGLRFVGSRKTPVTNPYAILGALIGLFLGGFVGARGGFGRVLISVFNPDLPEQDFGTLLGAIGGSILGAFFLAFLCGILHILIVRPEKVTSVEDLDDLSEDTA